MEERHVCIICGEDSPMCFTDGDVCICEEHFEEYMNEEFNFWRQNDHEGDEHWHGGFYDWYDVRDGSWNDTGIYWTEY